MHLGGGSHTPSRGVKYAFEPPFDRGLFDFDPRIDGKNLWEVRDEKILREKGAKMAEIREKLLEMRKFQKFRENFWKTGKKKFWFLFFFFAPRIFFIMSEDPPKKSVKRYEGGP